MPASFYNTKCTNGPVVVNGEDAPYVQKDEDLQVTELKVPIKSYRNESFLGSYDGRLIRVMCEFEEPKQRLRRNYIRSTVLFFGSARSMNRQQFDSTLARLTHALHSLQNRNDINSTSSSSSSTQHNHQHHELGNDTSNWDEIQRQEKEEEEMEEHELNKQEMQIRDEIARLKTTEWMCPWVDVAQTLAKKVSEFARDEQELIHKSFQFMPDYFRLSAHDYHESVQTYKDNCHDLVVTTGGGPGFMEAANKGASSVSGAKTMGMGISLPFEKGLNAYVSDDLAFEFHYFFTRKFWMMYSCRAIVVAPGGFGTLDELFELLTLKQTRKIPDLPVILLGTEFWKSVVNWQALANYGVVSQSEIDALCFTDDPDDALEFIKNFYLSLIHNRELTSKQAHLKKQKEEDEKEKAKMMAAELEKM